MLTRIKTLFSALLRQILPKPKGVPLTTSAPANSGPAHSHGPSPSDPPLGADLFTPRHASVHTIDFKGELKGGSVQARSEQWSREGNTLRCDRQTTMVETCAGYIRPVSATRARCAVSGKHAEHVAHCLSCGDLVCMKHIRGLRTEEGDSFFCPKCLEIKLRNWRTWSKKDGKLTRSYPPEPFCPAASSQAREEPKDEE